MENTLQRIISVMSDKGVMQKDLTDALGLSEPSFAAWKSGRNQSYLKYLHAIADFLGVSVEYLRGETDEKKKPPVGEDEGLTNEERLLLALFNKIPQEEKSEAIRKIIDALNN
jgi:transcriptional regulator with XRE-family HTH domain